MTTKLEVLGWYNLEHGTSFTMAALAQELLTEALKSQYRAKLNRDLVIPALV